MGNQQHIFYIERNYVGSTMNNINIFDLLRRSHRTNSTTDNLLERIGANISTEMTNTNTCGRLSERTKCWFPALVFLPMGERREGMVIDYSNTGLRIRLRRLGRYPDKVRVSVPRLGITCDAQVKWQKNHEVGLRRLN